MKILAFSDFHGLWGLQNHFIEVKKKLEIHEPDLLLLCGDLQDGGYIRTLEQRLRNLHFKNIFFVWGNSEEQLDMNLHLKNAVNIHLALMKFEGLDFFGLGGDEVDLKLALPKAREKLRKASTRELVIVSHVPPRGAVDTCNDGRQVGVPEFRDFIEQTQPILVACGHIHEQEQQATKIGRTLVCNVGRKGVLFTIKKRVASFLKLK
ncbi:MAG: metallophosphoesterase family protein [Candidatus Helarchaeota archaeon]